MVQRNNFMDGSGNGDNMLPMIQAGERRQVNALAPQIG